ncbi:hypothetical protein GCM10009621_17570 [Corynebacterium felinum]
MFFEEPADISPAAAPAGEKILGPLMPLWLMLIHALSVRPLRLKSVVWKGSVLIIMPEEG